MAGRTGTALLAWAIAVASAFAQDAAPVRGRLAGAVLLAEAPLTAGDLPADLSSADRLRLLGYVERWAAFRTRQGAIAGADGTWKRRERLEREIASVIERDGVEKAAHAIAWWPNGPYGLTDAIDADEEAAWAERVARDPANAVAAPFLYAFLASRYRLQFEQAGDDRPTLERLAKKYRTMLERVRNAGDAIFVLLADDLDGRTALNPGSSRHPRQYLPDT